MSNTCSTVHCTNRAYGIGGTHPPGMPPVIVSPSACRMMKMFPGVCACAMHRCREVSDPDDRSTTILSREYLMPILSPEDLKSVVTEGHGPAVSIFLPTHRAGPDIQQDSIRLKNLLKQ